MIARGKHIQTLNETFAVRKSEGGVVYDCDSPYKASAGLDNTEEIRKALKPDSFKADIDSVMAKRQEAR